MYMFLKLMMVHILNNMSYGATVGASAARPNTRSNLIEFKK